MLSATMKEKEVGWEKIGTVASPDPEVEMAGENSSKKKKWQGSSLHQGFDFGGGLVFLVLVAVRGKLRRLSLALQGKKTQDASLLVR